MSFANDDAPEPLISIADAARQLGLNKSTLSRQVKAQQIRSHQGKVRLSEVIADRAANVGAERPGTPTQPATAPARVASKRTVARRPLHESNATARNATPRSDATPPVASVPAAVGELISIGEAARQLGLNKSTLSRQVRARAVRSHAGKVRLAEVLEDRAKNIDLSKSGAKGRRGGKRDATSKEGEELPEQLPMVVVDGELLPFAQAQALKENYLARLRQLEFQQKSGEVVDRAEAEALFFTLAREQRDAWLTWAPRIAILMAADLQVDAALLSETLARYVQQHLGELGEPVTPELISADRQLASGVAAGDDAAVEVDGT